MRRDSIFYRLFSQFPQLLFGLLENPPDNATAYRFDSVGVKEPRFEIDGVFLPPEDAPPGTVFFVGRAACHHRDGDDDLDLPIHELEPPGGKSHARNHRSET